MTDTARPKSLDYGSAASKVRNRPACDLAILRQICATFLEHFTSGVEEEGPAMKVRSQALQMKIVQFLRGQDGTSTIEFVMLVPLFMMLLLLVADASMLFLRHTSLMNVSRDTARMVSRYALTPAEAKAYAEANASTARSRATARVTVSAGSVTVIITANAASSAPFGIVAFAVGDLIAGRTISTMEPL